MTLSLPLWHRGSLHVSKTEQSMRARAALTHLRCAACGRGEGIGEAHQCGKQHVHVLPLLPHHLAQDGEAHRAQRRLRLRTNEPRGTQFSELPPGMGHFIKEPSM